MSFDFETKTLRASMAFLIVLLCLNAVFAVQADAQQKVNDDVIELEDENGNVAISGDAEASVDQDASSTFHRKYYHYGRWPVYYPNYYYGHRPTYYYRPNGYYQQPSYYNTPRPAYYQQQNRPTVNYPAPPKATCGNGKLPNYPDYGNFNYDNYYVYNEECATHCSSPSGTLKELGICWDKSNSSLVVDSNVLTHQNYITFITKTVLYYDSPLYNYFENEKCNFARRYFNQTGVTCVTKEECCGPSKLDVWYYKSCSRANNNSAQYYCICVKDKSYMPSNMSSDPDTCEAEDDRNDY